MPVHLLIDGYNLLRHSPSFRDQNQVALELGRDALLERLRQYKRIRGHRITVVFDAASKPRLATEEIREKGIRIIYSGQGEIADAVIKRICRRVGSKLLVVTSDLELAAYAERHGAVTMASEDFEAKLEMALYLESSGGEQEDENDGWHPGKGTKKKGPARRLSKKEKKRRQRWRKL
jgi:predicted RNA-binding protein with PIN domain